MFFPLLSQKTVFIICSGFSFLSNIIKNESYPYKIKQILFSWSYHIPTAKLSFTFSLFLLSDQKPDVMYADIGGMDIQKQEVREAVELPLTHFELYKQVRYSGEMWLFCMDFDNFSLITVREIRICSPKNVENLCWILIKSCLFPLKDWHWPTQGCPHVWTSGLW